MVDNSPAVFGACNVHGLAGVQMQGKTLFVEYLELGFPEQRSGKYYCPKDTHEAGVAL